MSETGNVSESGNSGGSGADPSGGGSDGGVSEDTKASVDRAMSDARDGDDGGSDDAGGTGDTAPDGPTDDMTAEDARATQERMESEARAAKESFETRERARRDADRMAAETAAEQTVAEALDQEVAAQNAVAAGLDPAAPAPETVDPEAVDPTTLELTLRDQMIAEIDGPLSDEQLAELDSFMASPEGQAAAEQFAFDRALETSNLTDAQRIEAMGHFTAGREIVFDDAGQITVDDYGNVATQDVLLADASGATDAMLDAVEGRSNAQIAADYARGINETVGALANSRWGWAAGVAFDAVALAAGGPVRFAASQAIGRSVDAVVDQGTEALADFLSPRTGLAPEDVAHLATAGGIIVGGAVLGWQGVKALTRNLPETIRNLGERANTARQSFMETLRGQEIRSDMLNADGTLGGRHNAGSHAPVFANWIEAGGTVRMLDDGRFEYSRRIDVMGDGNMRDVSVTYTNGFPDFTDFMTHPTGVRSVSITVTGGNTADFRAANIAAGHPEWGSRPPPGGWTWHHHEDTRTMMLVPTEINNTFNHLGGAGLARRVDQ